jgi:hypothetical protein
MSGKLDALLGVLTQSFTRAPTATGARDSGLRELRLERLVNDAGFANASPQVERAIAESHSRHVRLERLLREAGLASEEPQAPEYLSMLEAGLESALRRPREKSR